MKFNIAIVDRRIPEDMERALFLRGFRVITLPPSDKLSEPMASHTDILLLRLGDNIVTTAEYCERALGELSEIYDYTRVKMHFTSDTHGKTYPDDVIFNTLVLGKRVYARLGSLSPYARELAEGAGYTLVDVRQGYPACTVMKLSDEAVITADPGLAELLLRDGIRVYKIENGYISLPPYEYGFIGGASGVFEGCAYFLGDMTGHPSYAVIEAACRAEGLTPVMLGRGVPLDLGGILFMQGDIDQNRENRNK